MPDEHKPHENPDSVYEQGYYEGRQTTLDEVKKVVNTVQADWFRYHIGGEPVASERLARQNGALSALQTILQALDTLSTKGEKK